MHFFLACCCGAKVKTSGLTSLAEASIKSTAALRRSCALFGGAGRQVELQVGALLLARRGFAQLRSAVGHSLTIEASHSCLACARMYKTSAWAVHVE